MSNRYHGNREKILPQKLKGMWKRKCFLLLVWCRLFTWRILGTQWLQWNVNSYTWKRCLVLPELTLKCALGKNQQDLVVWGQIPPTPAIFLVIQVMFTLTVGRKKIVKLKFWQCWCRQLVGLNSGHLFSQTGDPLEGYYLEWMYWLVLRSERVKYSLAMLPVGTCNSDKDFPVVLWRMIPPGPSFACSPWACLEVPVTWLILFELEIMHLIIIWSAADAWLLKPKLLLLFCFFF